MVAPRDRRTRAHGTPIWMRTTIHQLIRPRPHPGDRPDHPPAQRERRRGLRRSPAVPRGPLPPGHPDRLTSVGLVSRLPVPTRSQRLVSPSRRYDSSSSAPRAIAKPRPRSARSSGRATDAKSTRTGLPSSRNSASIRSGSRRSSRCTPTARPVLCVRRCSRRSPPPRSRTACAPDRRPARRQRLVQERMDAVEVSEGRDQPQRTPGTAAAPRVRSGALTGHRTRCLRCRGCGGRD